MIKNNFFPTLYQALESENLLGSWNMFKTINYDETVRHYVRDIVIIIYRDNRGFYERPIHYKTL
jgi:hypothetical protein